MDFELQKVFDEHLDLYEILEFSESRPFEELGTSDIKRQYRALALTYHPDKQPDNPDALHKFHLISLATHILTDSLQKEKYDSWLRRTKHNNKHNSTHRNELIEKLQNREKEAFKIPVVHSASDIGKIQEYGENLRKLKHFKLSYGNWKKPGSSTDYSNSLSFQHKYYDSSTLRLEVVNYGPSVANKVLLKQNLTQIFKIPTIYDIYYSARNDFAKDKIITAYVVFDSPQEALAVFKRWTKSSGEKEWYPVADIAPRIPLKYYSNFDEKVELNGDLSAMIRNDAIIID